MEKPLFTVGEFLDTINELLGAQDVQVVGEVVGAKPHPTGLYFSLKDKDGGGLLDCYMSPYAYRGLGILVQDGMEVKVGGAPSIYKPRGRFSFRVETLESVGEGALKKAYEALKKKLQEEGLFDRKRPLPEFIGRIGLVTSKTGAVIDDFRKNLAQLGLHVQHRDVRVEGDRAVTQVVAAIKSFNTLAHTPDVLVVIRGGGSMEDLAAFNNEHVVRAVFASRIPTIVAIGHDRDVPLAQMAGDASASTPTATAGLINATWDRLRNVDRTAQQLQHAFEAVLGGARADVQAHTHRLAAHLGRLAGRGRELEQHIRAALERVGHGITNMRQTVDAAERHLNSASPERLLKLGYSIVTDVTGDIIRSVRQVYSGQELVTRLTDGTLFTTVREIDIINKK